MRALVVFLLVFTTVKCAKILCIFPTPFHSHQSVFRPIWLELSRKGHEVTVITTDPVEITTISNLQQIDLSFSYKLVFETHQMQEIVNTQSNLLILMNHVMMIMNNMTREQLKVWEIQKLLKSDESFDLMIVEAHVPAWFGLAAKFRCPIIATTSMSPTSHYQRVLGNLANPVYNPHGNLPFSDEDLSLFQRIISVIFEIFEEALMSYLIYPSQQKIITDAVGIPDINLLQIVKNISLLFANIIPGFSKVSTSIPAIVSLNGLHISSPKPLEEDLQTFLDSAEHGVIYFSLGSNIKSNLLSEETKGLFLDVFKNLPFKVIWKFEDSLKHVPKNVKLLKWSPQQDILRHKNVKLFITQGGLQSIEEGLHFGVPMLALPFFGDQFRNSQRLKILNVGSWLNFKSLTKETLQKEIQKLVDNSTILTNLEEISDLLKSPIEAVDKAVWWVEFVLRHGGAPHLRSPLADMPFYQYYLLDIFAFLLLFVLMIIFVIWWRCKSGLIKQKIQ